MKRIHKQWIISAIIAVLLLSTACALGPVEPADSTQSPSPTAEATATLPPLQDTPSPTPQTTPAQSVGPDDEYALDELVGIATAEDLLPLYESYEQAKSVNDEVIGWVSVAGTNVSYPVARTDNNKYYLGRNVEKEKSRYGCIFMDFRNADALQQKHIILYGHNMKNGTMFHELANFKQRDFFDENRYIYFLWDGTDTVWEIFCAYTIVSESIYPIHTRFNTAQNFADVMNSTIEYAKTVNPSNLDSSVVIKSTDQVITLLTCTYEYDNSRFAVMARRVK